jgi:Tfp pilus assembly protein PilO
MAYHGLMLGGRNQLLARIALLKQKERELKDTYTQKSISGQETKEVETMLVAVTAEISLLESMLSY